MVLMEVQHGSNGFVWQLLAAGLGSPASAFCHRALGVPAVPGPAGLETQA